MSSSPDTRRLCCYAVLKSGFTGSNYLIPHMRLVLRLINIKKYKTIDAKTLVGDFTIEYGYTIDYFPMLRILGLAVENGYLCKNHNSKRFTCTQKIEEYDDIDNSLSENEKLLTRLVENFQLYSKTQGVDYSYSECEKIILTYISSQKIEHITGRIGADLKDIKIDYVLGKYLYTLKENDHQLFEYINGMVIGSILADCLVFHENIENGTELKDVSVIIDTSPVFMCLGIDVANRQEYYQKLFQSLQNKGAKLLMFEHSYNEMQQILAGAIDWVENAYYDPAKASDTTEYFRSIGASKSDIQEFSYSLKRKIKELGIEIIQVSHDKENWTYHEDESKIYQMIVERYKLTNPSFNEIAQRNSIELDARSISYTYVLREGINAVHLTDSKFIFVTSNKTLAKVASAYHNETPSFTKTLPTTLSDILIGTFIWLGDPIQIEKMNEQQIVAHAYLAFQPNGQLLSKLSSTLNKLVETDTIDANLCYSIMCNDLITDRIMQKTLGDPNAFTDDTPIEVIEEIRNEAKMQGVEETEIRYNEILKKNEEKQDEIINSKNLELANMQQAILTLQKGRLNDKENELRKANECLSIAQKHAGRCKKAIIISMIVILATLVVAVISCIFFKGKDWFSPVVANVCQIISAILAVTWLLYTMIKEESMNLAIAFKKQIERIENRKYKKLGYTKEQRDELEQLVRETKAEIQKIETELTQSIKQ